MCDPHIYDEDIARRIYYRIGTYAPGMRREHTFLLNQSAVSHKLPTPPSASDLAQALAYPRFFVDKHMLQTKSVLDTRTTQALRQIDYGVQYHPDAMFYGGVHALSNDHKRVTCVGAADPRRG